VTFATLGRVLHPRSVLCVLCYLCVLCIFWIRLGPLPDGLLDLTGADSAVIVDRNGEILYEARGADGGRVIRLAAADLPSLLVDATLSAEDGRFMRHPGVDAIAIARAVIHDIRRRRLAEGGSTITQQVAKLLLVRLDARTGGAAARNRRRGLGGKLREAVTALRLEHRLTKREILALYLNQVSYGNQLLGAERASREYFGVPAASLTAAQAAFLAALPQRPSSFNPYRAPAPFDAAQGSGERSRTTLASMRQQYVLRRMVIDGRLSVAAAAEALHERLNIRRQPAAFAAPHFVQRVLALTEGQRSERIVTTLDLELQLEVEGIIRSRRIDLDRHGAHNVAVAVLDNRSGEWLAWEGSGDYTNAAHAGTIDGVVTPRQPGSALKPFTYALAFEAGESPASVLPDVPSYFPTADAGILYSPRNYDGRFRGPLLARQALAGSENVPAVAAASRVGVPTLLRFLRGAGFTTFDQSGAYYGLGLTLGDAEVRLDELVTAYAAFARGGVPVSPSFTRSAAPAPLVAKPIIASRTAFWITDILSDATAREYIFGRGSSLDFPFAVAAKTGTSQSYRDNWTIGYTRDLTVGVWVGNFDRTPLVGSSGVTGAGPIFHDVMMAAVRRTAGEVPFSRELPTAARPELTERRRVCALSGMAAGRWCPSEIEEWTAAESPSIACSWHRPDGSVQWPHEYLTWAQSARGPREESESSRAAARASGGAAFAKATASLAVARGNAGERRRGAPRALKIDGQVGREGIEVLSPPAGATYLIDPTLRREFQTISFRAASGDGGPIEWLVDDRPIGSSDADGSLDWPLAAGKHIIAARDRRGNRDETAILVK
jgi:penicillin-binding protein 1C